MTGPVDFATVQWARKISGLAASAAGLAPADLAKLGSFLVRLAELRQNEGELSEAQLQVILQGLHSKELARLEAHQGGIFVEFTGGGFEYERFLVREDGRVPNNRYEAKKAV